MIDSIYQIYREHRELIEKPELAQTYAEKLYLAEITVGVVILEEHHPEYRERYEREKNTPYGDD